MAAFGGKRALGMIVCTRNVLRRLFSRLRDSNACLAEMRGINGHAARCLTGDSPRRQHPGWLLPFQPRYRTTNRRQHR